jgi:nicotinate-nucleotide adenylyltransferase
MEKKQIVVFGGCFNPPLNSHFSLAQQLVNEYDIIEKLIFIPVSCKYQKTGLLSNEHRYNMLKLVCNRNEQFDVSRIEIDSTIQPNTVETLRKIQMQYPNNEIAFIIGSDNLKEIETWKKADELVKDFKIYVFERARDIVEEIINSSKFLKEHENNFIKAKNNITSNLSSTFVRGKIKEGKSIRYLLPDEVIEYIRKNELYK